MSTRVSGAVDERHPAHLRVEGLRVRYGGVQALDDVTFDAEPGEIVGLIGANGSGKTTTLDVISGLVRPQAGTVRLDGIDLGEHLPEERLRVGMVRSFQDCRLYPELTVLDVLLLSEDARHEVAVIPTTLRLPWARRAERRKLEAADQVIAAFGLERFRHHRTAELSTGTRRVVDLASIVLARPRLLLLDEPTAGIAQREAEAFIPLLRRLHQVADTTIVLVEHDVPLVFELCSTVIVMELGQVVAAGPPEQVRADPRALAAYLGASDEALMASGPVAEGGERSGGSGGTSGSEGEGQWGRAWKCRGGRDTGFCGTRWRRSAARGAASGVGPASCSCAPH